MNRRLAAWYRRLFARLRPDLAEVADEAGETVRARLEGAARRGPLPWMGTLLRETTDLARGAAGLAWAGYGHDARTAVRSLVRRPRTALLAAGALGTGVAAVTMAAALLTAIGQKAVPFPQADRLVAVYAHRDDAGEGDRELRVVEWEAYGDAVAKGGSQLDRVGGSWPTAVTLTGAGEPVRLAALRVTPGWFETLGVDPADGRFFGPAAEDGALPRVVVSWTLWMDRLGGTPSSRGARVELDGTMYEVVGVAPRGFEGPTGPADIYLHHAFGTDGWTGRWLTGVARLSAGATAAGAADELARLNDRAAEQAGMRGGWNATVRPLRDELFGGLDAPLRLAGAGALLLLLATAASTAGLLLARTLSRAGELRVRTCLGGDRRRILRLVVLEGALLALVAGVAGVGVGALGVRGLVRILGDLLPYAGQLGTPPRVLAVGLGAAVFAGAVAVALPALVAAHLSAAGPGGAGGLRGGVAAERSLTMLVGAEVALAFVLVTLTGGIVASVNRLVQQPLGFSPEGAWTFSVALPTSRYGDRGAAEFFETLRTGLEGEAGVAAVGAGSDLPVGGAGAWATARRSDPGAADVGVPVLQRTVGPGWFRAVGGRILEGRDFEAADGVGDEVVVVSRRLADALWPGQSPLGRRFSVGTDAPAGGGLRVIGVVEDVRFESLEGTGRPQYYEPHRQAPWLEMTLVVRSTLEAGAVADRVRAAVAQLDAGVAVTDRGSLESGLRRATGPRRLTAGATGFFALACLVVVMGGVGGASAVALDRRRREYAVRLAVGARPSAVAVSTLRRSAVVGMAGLGVGWSALIVLAPLSRSLFFGLGVLDARATVTAGMFVLAVAMAAALPATAVAAATDPAETLRSD